MRNWHAMPVKEAIKELAGDSDSGLTEQEAAKRLAEHGRNEISSGKKVSAARLFAEQFTSPLVMILIAASAVSFAFGKGIDGVLIIAIVIANGVFGFVQNYNAEKSIEALRSIGTPKALVLRSGKAYEMDSSGLVPGDIILLREGAKVPADCRIMESFGMRIDESILTGESVPVGKTADTLAEETMLAERANMLFMDTLLVSGRGKAIVVETGDSTEVGSIARSIASIEEEPTRFHREIEALGGKIGRIIVVLVAIIFSSMLLLHGAEPIDAAIMAISVAVAAIPEGLPAVVTLALSLSTRRMLARNALVRKLPVLENLGSVQIICTDKTGTMTENRMTVQRVFCNWKNYEATGTGMSTDGAFIHGGKTAKTAEISETLLCGMLCNDTITGVQQGSFTGDPTEVALTVSALKAGLSGAGWKRVKEYPFSPQRKRMTVVAEKAGRLVAYSKGAPEAIIGSCTRILADGGIGPLTDREKARLLGANDEMAGQALRVLAFAKKDMESAGGDAEQGMVFLGLQGMIDPPREEVSEALRTARDAGIRVMMLTGDNSATAMAIGKRIGFSDTMIGGAELAEMTPEEFGNAVMEHDIFSRMGPEQKFMVLKELKRRGFSVAMTGDGVNDAPALKEADVGIAMGIRGSDVAKEAADIVLLDDNFATIVEAVRQGRGVFDNIRKFVNYLLSNNIAEVLIVFIASLAGHLALSAVMLLWINLLTDGLPALALGADRPRPGVMKEPPRKSGAQIISTELGTLMLAVSAIITVIVLALFYYSLPRGLAFAQTMVFTSLVVYEFVRIVAIKRQEGTGIFSNKWLIVALAISMSLQLAILYGPLSSAFGTIPLAPNDWLAIILGGAIGYFLSMAATRIVVGMAMRREAAFGN
ncbi:MAG: cation-transporting P-type ATPase [Candidatus Diapherotrites archaeon]|uniref:Cation-transporting P-type ATPase n=1 Tax=Candidatus Iainarchaeum sp. TaxID=3101447 RepID=A0A8T3YNT7_9ARCH|nr:cation-transporting P-type ATPase [Candidatus Diapherotrites archaeon]